MTAIKDSSSGPTPAERLKTPGLATDLARALGRNLVINFVLWGRAARRPPRAHCPPPSARAIAAIALALAATISAMFLVDRTATAWAHHLPSVYVHVFDQISNAGLSGWFLIPAAVILLVLWVVTSPTLPRLTRGLLAALFARFWFLFWAIAAPGLFATTIKRLIGRARPYMDVHGNPFTYMPFGWREQYASMPSGHATTVASVAVAIGALWPRTRPFLWLYALVIMFSRVVVMAHHPSDVLGGALVGAVGAAWIRRIFAARGLVFSARSLKARPFPSLRRLRRAARDLLAQRRPIAADGDTS
jgi:membrane-associated phospholipid phosphatase